jgi:hypothetical protein
MQAFFSGAGFKFSRNCKDIISRDVTTREIRVLRATGRTLLAYYPNIDTHAQSEPWTWPTSSTFITRVCGSDKVRIAHRSSANELNSPYRKPGSCSIRRAT